METNERAWEIRKMEREAERKKKERLDIANMKKEKVKEKARIRNLKQEIETSKNKIPKNLKKQLEDAENREIRGMPILVAKDTMTGYIIANVVPKKGECGFGVNNNKYCSFGNSTVASGDVSCL